MIRVHVHLSRPASAATTIAAESAQSQSATVSTNVSDPPSVLVTDALSNPVAGVTVTFAVTAGGGSRSPATVNTNASGIATLTSWTLGASEGTNTLTATAAGLTGSPVSFDATGTEAGQLVDLSGESDELRFMVGTHLPPGVLTNPGMSNFETFATSRNAVFEAAFDLEWFFTGTGTVAVTPGSPTVTVSGGGSFTGQTFRVLRFTRADIAQGRQYIMLRTIAGDGLSAEMVVYNHSAGDWVAWNYNGPTPESGLAWGISNFALNDAQQCNYYDRPLAAYRAAGMHGSGGMLDATQRAHARFVADKIAATDTWCELTQPGTMGIGATPRSVALLGMICRALDGKPEYWPVIRAHVNQESASWLGRHQVGGPLGGYAELVAVRDCGYALQHIAALGATDPDPVLRAAYLEQAIEYAIDPIIRYKWADHAGGLHWFSQSSAIPGLMMADGATWTPFSQFFIIPLLVNGLIMTHRAMRWAGMTGDSRYAEIGDAIIASQDGRIHQYKTAAKGSWPDPEERAGPYFHSKVGGFSMLTVSSAVGSATLNSIVLPSSAGYDNAWMEGAVVLILTGPGAGEQKPIPEGGWNQGTTTASGFSNWIVTPTSASTYSVGQPLKVLTPPGGPETVHDYLFQPTEGDIINNDRQLNPTGAAAVAYADALVGGNSRFKVQWLEEMASSYEENAGISGMSALYYNGQSLKNSNECYQWGLLGRAWATVGLVGDDL